MNIFSIMFCWKGESIMDKGQELITAITQISEKNGFVTPEEINEECSKVGFPMSDIGNLYFELVQVGITIGKRPIPPLSPNPVQTPSSSPATFPQPTSDSNADSLLSIIKERGLIYVDKTGHKGALWVVGGRELKGCMDEIKQITGEEFVFCPNGGKASKHQPAWFWK